MICSHTLEDVRDPLWVCREINRVGKRGYVEVPSRTAESCRGIEPRTVGWSHHRWLVDIKDSHFSFLMKYHMIHSHWRFSLPSSHLSMLSQERQLQWLFWEGQFTYSEQMLYGMDEIENELESFVRATKAYPLWWLLADRRLRRTRRKLRRNLRRLAHSFVPTRRSSATLGSP